MPLPGGKGGDTQSDYGRAAATSMNLITDSTPASAAASGDYEDADVYVARHAGKRCEMQLLVVAPAVLERRDGIEHPIASFAAVLLGIPSGPSAKATPQR